MKLQKFLARATAGLLGAWGAVYAILMFINGTWEENIIIWSTVIGVMLLGNAAHFYATKWLRGDKMKIRLSIITLLLFTSAVYGQTTPRAQQKRRALVIHDVTVLYRAPDFHCWQTPRLNHRMETISYTQFEKKGKRTFWECGTFPQGISQGVKGAQVKYAHAPQQPKPAEPIKMPADYSAQLTTLQQQSDKLTKDYEKVIELFKEYAAKRDAIQSQAAVLITRAALAAKLTIDQLDNSDLKVDDKGNYQWVPRPKAETAKAKTPASP